MDQKKDFRIEITQTLMFFALLLGSGMMEDMSDPAGVVRWMYMGLAKRFNEVRFERVIEVGLLGEGV